MRFSYYNRLSRQQQAIYRKSDAIASIRIPEGPALGPLVSAIRDSLSAASQPRTRDACQTLVDELVTRFAVPALRVTVAATRPVLRGGDDLYGLYEPAGARAPAMISVWMRTSRRKNVVAFRTFLRTLIHELCHHLDYELLGLGETFHTAGFYQRESSLMRQLFEQVTRDQ